MRVLIEFERNPLLFENPEELIRCEAPAELGSAFERMERLSRAGFYLAGFLSYEAGYALERHFKDPGQYSFPLLLMGAYRAPDHRTIGPVPGASWQLTHFHRNISREEYAGDITRIREYIACGDVYQITYCIKLRFRFSGDPFAFYACLKRSQPVPYPAFIDAGDFQILSLSPERFITRQGARVTTEPMKGTWMRGKDPLSDMGCRRAFSRDIKNRAENVMIADLLRNDLGRIGENVEVPQLFRVTPYKTLFQMTSIVTARVDPQRSFREIFTALFPSGSVTGAPKVRAMEIIRKIEREPRGIYTGAIGWIAPNRDLYFNVPIRTVHLQEGRAEMGVGGGIVWDSTADGEWDEGVLKARFMTDLVS